MSRSRIFALAALLLAGCQQVATIPTPISPHKIDIQQGNVVTQEMVDKLRPGMTQSQVRFILGTPLVVDTFHKDRWDYVYRYEKAGALVEHRRLVVIFENDKLARLEGDVVAAKPRAPEPPQAGKPAAAKPEAPKTAEPAPQGANPAPPSPDPVAAPAGQADAAAGAPQGSDEKSKEEKPQPEKPKEERGFFGKMLERLGL